MARLEAFCAREYPRLRGALALYCGDVGVAEELAQEALSRACDRWSHVSTLAAPGAWVHRVALNLAKSGFRRRQAERRAQERLGPPPDELAAPDVAGAVAVRGAVAALPPRQRAVIALRFYLDLSVAETADLLALSPDAVRQHTARAVAALRARFPQEHAR